MSKRQYNNQSSNLQDPSDAKQLQMLEVIEQKSQEGSPLLPKKVSLVQESSHDQIINRSLQREFKINLQSQQNHNDSMADHLKMLAQPGQANQSILTNVKHQQQQLKLQTNQIICHMDAQNRSKMIPRHELQIHPVPLTAHKETKTLQGSESKQSFMQRHIDAHRPPNLTQDTTAHYINSNRQKYTNT